MTVDRKNFFSTRIDTPSGILLVALSRNCVPKIFDFSLLLLLFIILLAKGTIKENLNFLLFRLIHINGASFYFLVIYIHIRQNIFYCSYKLNRVWGIGIIILLISIAAAFIGYVLPWGQISYWGATVITNLLSAIPWYLLVKVYGRLKEFFVRMCFYTWKKKFTRRCIIADSVISYIIYYVLLYIIACACDV